MTNQLRKKHNCSPRGIIPPLPENFPPDNIITIENSPYSRSQIHLLRKKGYINVFRLNGSIVIVKDDLDRYEKCKGTESLEEAARRAYCAPIVLQFDIEAGHILMTNVDGETRVNSKSVSHYINRIEENYEKLDGYFPSSDNLDFIPTWEARRLTGFTRAWLSWLALHNRIEAYKIGGQWLYSLRDIQSLVAKRPA